jgi:hypothetical protein
VLQQRQAVTINHPLPPNQQHVSLVDAPRQSPRRNNNNSRSTSCALVQQQTKIKNALQTKIMPNQNVLFFQENVPKFSGKRRELREEEELVSQKKKGNQIQIVFTEEIMEIAQHQVHQVTHPASQAKAQRSAISAWTRVKAEFARTQSQTKWIWDPLLGLWLLRFFFRATTTYRYAKTIRRLFAHEFSNVPEVEVRNMMKSFQTLSNLSVKDMAAVPATPVQVKRLIGNLTRPEQRIIFCMWTTAARHIETEQWVRKYFSRRHVLCLTNLWSKSDPTGMTSQHRWITCPHRKLMQKLFQQAPVSYHQVLRFIKKIEPTLSCHSFRKGAIQVLEKKFAPPQIAHLTWHRNPMSVSPSMQPYSARTPLAPAVQTILQMTNHLQQQIGYHNLLRVQSHHASCKKTETRVQQH